MTKNKRVNLESSIEKLESEVRLYHDLDAVIKSHQNIGELSDKDIISVLERIKFQVILDTINRQNGIKDKLDRFTKKWNLFSRQDKPTETSLVESMREEKLETDILPAETPEVDDKDYPDENKKSFQLTAEKKDTDTFFNRLKRKFKISRCENCGYFYVEDAEKCIYQCTLFELSSQVNKKDVCEHWTDSKKLKQPFF